MKFDHAALYGAGGARPLGLRNHRGVNEVTMGANGALQKDYDDVLDLIQEIED